MKLIPKTPADFGIPFTGSELRDFNKRFSEFFPEADNRMTAKSKIFLYIIGIVCFAANVFIPFRHAPGFLMKAVIAALPVILAGVFVYACFMKDSACKTRLRNIMLSYQILLIFPIGITALTGFKLLDYLIYAVCMIIGIIIGVNGWGKRTMKLLAVSAEETEVKGRLARGIAAAVSAALVPVIRMFVGSAGKTAGYIVLGLLTSFLCVLLGWVSGLGIENVRYYRFIKNGKNNRRGRK